MAYLLGFVEGLGQGVVEVVVEMFQLPDFSQVWEELLCWGNLAGATYHLSCYGAVFVEGLPLSYWLISLELLLRVTDG